MPSVYRSGYPNARNFAFLTKLGIKTILNLNRESYLPNNVAHAQASDIAIHQVKLQSNVEPFLQSNPLLVVVTRISRLLHARSHP
jgi:tyrosine-protein phosphatase SIW14